MISSLKSISFATRMSISSRRSRAVVFFQLTMNPSMPAAFAQVMCWRITDSSSLEYGPRRGMSVFARFHEFGSNQM